MQRGQHARRRANLVARPQGCCPDDIWRYLPRRRPRLLGSLGCSGWFELSRSYSRSHAFARFLRSSQSSSAAGCELHQLEYQEARRCGIPWPSRKVDNKSHAHHIGLDVEERSQKANGRMGIIGRPTTAPRATGARLRGQFLCSATPGRQEMPPAWHGCPCIKWRLDVVKRESASMLGLAGRRLLA